MSRTKSLEGTILYIIGIVLIQIAMIWYIWLYSINAEFGSGAFRIANLYFYILVPAIIFAFGCVFVGWNVRKSRYIPIKQYHRILNWVIGFFGILSSIMILTIWKGLPFDASYSWGINAIMFSKAITALLPGVLCIITIITLLIATAGLFWLMLFKIGVIVGVTALIYKFLVPIIMVYL